MNFEGTSGNDKFVGGADPDTIMGLAGNDRLAGSGGADLIFGGDGNDTLFSGGTSIVPDFRNQGDGIVLDDGTDRDRLSGDDGSDVIFAGYGDTIDGGSGRDALALSFMGATSGVTVDFGVITSGASVTIGETTIANIDAMLWVRGSAFDDMLDLSNAGGFGVEGGDGDDHILSNGGQISGGNGNDLIENGNDYYSYIYGGDGDDVVTGGQYWTDGGSGNDTIASVEYALGGDGDDILRADPPATSFGAHLAGGAGMDTITGAEGNDILNGGSDADTITGGNGDDVILSGSPDADFRQDFSLATDDIGSEHDEVFGGDGDDRISIGYGDDADGGNGTDELSLSAGGATKGVTIDTGKILSGEVSFGGGTITGFEEIVRVRGSEFGDRIATDAAIVQGGGGDDRVTATGRHQLIVAGDGDDRLLAAGQIGNLFGDDGSDTIDYSGLAVRISVELGELNTDFDIGPGTDTLRNTLHDIENIMGTAFDDRLSGSGLANHIEGMDGNDVIVGGIGNDWLEGGAGDDSISVTAWNRDIGMERLSGGTGHDRLLLDQSDGYQVDFSNATVVDFEMVRALGTDLIMRTAQVRGVTDLTAASLTLADGGTVDFSAGSFSGVLHLSDAGNTALLDNTGVNLVFGGIGNDRIVGGGGKDEVHAGAGKDGIDGGGGADVLDGGDGDDVLTGGAGRDTLTGGAGRDSFRFAGGDTGNTVRSADTIADFSHADHDKIDLSAVDAVAGTPEVDAFRFVGDAAFSGSAGELRYEVSRGNTLVMGDTDGDGIADLVLRLTGSVALVASDFARGGGGGGSPFVAAASVSIDAAHALFGGEISAIPHAHDMLV